MLRPSFAASRWGWLLPSLVVLACGACADAEPTASVVKAGAGKGAESALGGKWVRLLLDKRKTPLAMQTAIVRYVPADDFDDKKALGDYRRYVDLVGAVHVADHAYYAKLNRRFKQYDAVLYELVAPEGTAVPLGRGTSNSHPLGALQNGMKNMLELEHQLEQIDYTRPNFVHADISPDEFFNSMENRDESFVQMYLKILGASLAHQSQQSADGASPDVEIMQALFAKDRARRLKIVMAKQFEGMETLMLAFNGTDGNTIITERNERALKVLDRELDAGKKKLAIFYGGGHLSDMHKRMVEQFDMEPVSVEWLDAWDLRAE
jgi:hypothetical protein